MDANTKPECPYCGATTGLRMVHGEELPKEMASVLRRLVDQLDHEETGEPGMSARDWIDTWQSIHDDAHAALTKAKA